jgi:two-component system nitrate/nitrite response regulator NarL
MEWDLDILMCNINVHSDECIDSVRRIKVMCPGVAVLFCSAFDAAYSVEFALRAQPSGYLCKPYRKETLIEAIDTLAEGGTYFSEKIRPWVEMGPDGPVYRGIE